MKLFFYSSFFVSGKDPGLCGRRSRFPLGDRKQRIEITFFFHEPGERVFPVLPRGPCAAFRKEDAVDAPGEQHHCKRARRKKQKRADAVRAVPGDQVRHLFHQPGDEQLDGGVQQRRQHGKGKVAFVFAEKLFYAGAAHAAISLLNSICDK